MGRGVVVQKERRGRDDERDEDDFFLVNKRAKNGFDVDSNTIESGYRTTSDRITGGGTEASSNGIGMMGKSCREGVVGAELEDA